MAIGCSGFADHKCWSFDLQHSRLGAFIDSMERRVFVSVDSQIHTAAMASKICMAGGLRLLFASDMISCAVKFPQLLGTENCEGTIRVITPF